MNASVNSIESFGLVDGPGIRTVVFFNGCKLRCKYCHNPETWYKKIDNYSVDELFNKIKRFKPYFNKEGGVTFSGGEPLLHVDFLIEICKKLKKEQIHIALDTAGCGIGKYEELLPLVDLVILDIKALNNDDFNDLTGASIKETLVFIEALKKSNCKVWIRQVVIPNLNDNYEYMDKLHSYLTDINNIEKIEFLPYHKLGSEKYESLNIPNPYRDKPEMDKDMCDNLYKYFMNL